MSECFKLVHLLSLFAFYHPVRNTFLFTQLGISGNTVSVNKQSHFPPPTPNRSLWAWGVAYNLPVITEFQNIAIINPVCFLYLGHWHMQFSSLDCSHCVGVRARAQARNCPIKYHPSSVILTVKNIWDECLGFVLQNKKQLDSFFKGIFSITFPRSY